MNMGFSFKHGIVILALAAAIAFWGLRMCHGRESERSITIGFPASWGDLKPALQHTIFADVILGNVYEPLARLTSRGTLRPAAARSWDVSDDRRIFTFKIDTSRRFSDGTPLSAHHFKSAWEHGLALTPKSANSSLADVLYKVVGSEAFQETRILSGVKVLDAETLQVEFKTPFRMALENLAGIRYSAVLIKDGHDLGTGPFRFVSHSEDLVKLERNPHSPTRASFGFATITRVPITEASEALKSGAIDAYHDFGRSVEPLCGDEGDIKCFAGLESAHETLSINGLPGRLFSDPKMRLALQALVYGRDFSGLSRIRKNSGSFRVEPQSFMPLQAGRLADPEAVSLAAQGAMFIPELVAATAKNPIYVMSNQSPVLVDILKGLGLHLAERSGYFDPKETRNVYYKTYEADILHSGFSVASGDPDGIYHLLGKEGAISSPMIQRPVVMELLEEGRKLVRLEDLPAFYQKLSRAIFSEVPYIHIGFRIAQIAYRSDRVRLNEAVKGRDDDDIILYEPL